jgi:FkbM family methyltransferase
VIDAVKKLAKSALERRSIYLLRGLPRGVNIAHDLRAHLEGQKFTRILDVGANVGQTTTHLLRDYPNAHIWAFEPGKKLYSVLSNSFSGNKRVTCEQAAVGSAVGEAVLLQTQVETMFHISTSDHSPLGDAAVIGSESVRMVTIDSYCRNHSLTEIDFLKIDTEGHDLEVLRGAAGMIKQGKIGCIQCECGLNPENTFHCSLEKVRSALEPDGYRLFGIYEQIREWYSNGPHLRRADVLFVSPRLIESYGRRHPTARSSESRSEKSLASDSEP